MTGGPRQKARQASSGAGEERWWYRGSADLVDVDVVVPPSVEPEDDTRFEVLSPEGSFAVYADSLDARDEWVTAIRNAKASLFVTLSATHPNTTLTSSASNAHIRRTLQALPHAPGEEPKDSRRGRVEHYVPAVWIPDAKTEACMRCGKPFGWRRRRHHCRLCGRCVCSGCSGSVRPSTPKLQRYALTCSADILYRGCQQQRQTIEQTRPRMRSMLRDRLPALARTGVQWRRRRTPSCTDAHPRSSSALARRATTRNCPTRFIAHGDRQPISASIRNVILRLLSRRDE